MRKFLGWNYWPVIQKIILPDKGDGGEDPNMPFDIGCILALAKQLALRGESELAERLRELPAKRFEDLPENDNPQT